jgi:hypothetical protein
VGLELGHLSLVSVTEEQHSLAAKVATNYLILQ